MAGITITVDDGDAQAQFTRLAAFGDEPMQLALADIGEHLHGTMLDRAAREEGPDGVHWVDLSPRYARRKAKLRPGRPMLKFDGFMLGPMFSPQLGEGFVDIGTNAIQGARQQLGGGGIEPRPFIGLSDQDGTDIREILAEYLQAVIDAS